MKTNFNVPKWFKYLLGLVAVLVLVIPAKAAAGAVGLAAMTNFSTVTFNDEEVKLLADVVMDEAFAQPEMTQFHTIVEGLIGGKQIVYSGLLQKITKADAGCSTGATSKEITFRDKFWAPAPVKVWLQLCANEFEQTLMNYSKKKGLQVDDITGTDISGFMVDHITPAMMEDAFRIAWFNDTSHTNIADSSGDNLITTGISLTDYNLIDGFFNQIFAIVAADSARRYTITANSAGSKTLQDSSFAAGESLNIFRALLQNADARLKGQKNKFILCTQSIFENYLTYLETQHQEASYVNLQNGMTAVKFRGVNVVAWDFFDRTIRADFDNGTTYHLPHRAILTTPQNLMIGLDDSGALKDLEIWYSQYTEKNNFRAKYKIDAKVAVDHLVQVAY